MKHPFVASLLLALLLSLFALSLKPVGAQDDAHEWSPPLRLFETTGRASEAEVVADQYGAVHVFWAYGAPGNEESGNGEAIYYARKQNGDWSDPVDVLISPGGRVARMQAVVADSQDYLHIVWSGGNAIFYSQAFALAAGSAQGWTYPLALTSGISALEPAIAAGKDQDLYVVWTQARAGLMFVQSQDSGQTWSAPQVIFQADQNNELARWGRIAVDKAGRIHVVLTYTINDLKAQYGRSDAMLLYYLRSDDNGATWSEPFLVTPEPDFGEINVATFGKDVVHLVWNGRAGRHGRYHRWSQDGGQTWSDVVEILAPAPQNPIGTGGLTGFPALVTDATGALHMVSATGGGDYYFRWHDGVWSLPVLISPGLDGTGVTKQRSSLEQPSIALSEGNQLHVVFHDGFERIWYTTSQAAAPPVEPVPLPVPTNTMESTALSASPEATPLLSMTPTAPVVMSGNLASAPPATRSGLLLALLGALSATVVIVIGAAASLARRRQR